MAGIHIEVADPALVVELGGVSDRSVLYLGTTAAAASSPVAVAVDVGLLIVTATGCSITLPPGGSHVGSLIVKDATGSAAAHPHTLTPDGSETIDGLSSLMMASDYGSVSLRWAVGAWHIT